MESEASPEIISWLLEGDPSIRWQVEKDLLGKEPARYNTTRKRISREGWGKSLLAFQDEAGTWGGGFYSPKWISTHYTLQTLARLGLDPANPQAHNACRLYLEHGFYDRDGGINLSARSDHSETCITGMALHFLAYFKVDDQRVDILAEHLLRQQLDDGGWNCRSYRGDKHSSFHTTISALEGLLSYQNDRGMNQALSASQETAQEFLWQHQLFRSHRTGEVVDQRMTRFPFPPRWYYDILRALDYFQAAGAARDPRCRDAVQVLRSKRTSQHTWLSYRGYSGRVFLELEPAGRPGRMNTLRALRALNWWISG